MESLLEKIVHATEKTVRNTGPKSSLSISLSETKKRLTSQLENYRRDYEATINSYEELKRKLEK